MPPVLFTVLSFPFTRLAYVLFPTAMANGIISGAFAFCKPEFLLQHLRRVRCRSRIVRSTSTLRCPAPLGSRRARYRLVSGMPRYMYASSSSTPPLPWWVSCHSLCVLMRPGDRSRSGPDPSVCIVCSFPVADQIVFRPRICTIRCPTHVP